MANLLADGLSWLDDQLKANASLTATYRRGAFSVSLQVQLGEQILKLFDAQGATKIMRTELDVLFHAADLILNSATVTPDRNDLVDITFGSTIKRYEAMPLPGGEAIWRYSDPHQNRIRLHLKQKGTV